MSDSPDELEVEDDALELAAGGYSVIKPVNTIVPNY